ncbi:MAG TPA: nuclear transport factor 2 family protein [Thermoanaerobaculia bacterium]
MTRRAQAGFALLFAAALPLSAAPAAPPPANAAEEVRKLEDRWLEALDRHDRTALDALLADDFMNTNWVGKVRTKQDVLNSLDDPGRPQGTQRLIDVQARVYGDTAVVTGTNIFTTLDQARVVRLRFTDVFVRRDGRWRAVAGQETVMGKGVK